MNLVSVVPKEKVNKAFVVLRSIGSSYLSKKTAVALGLKDGDCIDFINDLSSKNNYYIIKSDAGIKVRDRNGTIEFTSRKTAKLFGWEFGVDHKVIKMPVGPKIMHESKELFPLITAGLKFEIK